MIARTKPNTFPRRLALTAGLIAAVHVFLICKLYFLQVVKHKDGEMGRMHEGFEILAARRGSIMDRHFRPLAMHRTHWTVTADPRDVKHPKEFSDRLGDILHWNAKTRAQYAERLRKGRQSKKESIPLHRNCSLAAREKIIAVSDTLSGVNFQKEGGRAYPQGTLASTVMGYVGGYTQGLGGLEKQYDRRLQGQQQKIELAADVYRRLLSDTDWTQSLNVNGQHLVLTIDEYIQFRTEKSLKKAIERTEAAGGIAVVMDPNNGEILAMAQAPDFDPAEYNKYGEYGEFRRKPRPVTDSHEPGSVIKSVIIASALEKGLVKPDTIFYCEKGRYSMPYRRTPLRDDIHTFGDLTIHDILVCSSNIGTVKVAQQMGEKETYAALRHFGFGERTGIDLPGEVEGVVPPPHKWSRTSISSIPFGQGITATAVQIAQAYAVFANGGKRVQPHLFLGYRYSLDGKFEPKNYREPERIISEKVANTISDILVDVTENHVDSSDPQARGTGREVKIPGYRICGKTGTSQVPPYHLRKRNASFVGYFPKANPRVVIFVLVREPKKKKYGGEVAGPVFKEVAQALIPYWGLLPSHPEEIETQQIARHPDKKQADPAVDRTGQLANARDNLLAGRVPELRGLQLRDCLTLLAESGVNAQLNGSSGRIVKQTLGPGEPIENDELGTLTVLPDVALPSRRGSPGAIATGESPPTRP